jgi:hypothetical protein
MNSLQTLTAWCINVVFDVIIHILPLKLKQPKHYRVWSRIIVLQMHTISCCFLHVSDATCTNGAQQVTLDWMDKHTRSPHIALKLMCVPTDHWQYHMSMQCEITYIHLYHSSIPRTSFVWVIRLFVNATDRVSFKKQNSLFPLPLIQPFSPSHTLFLIHRYRFFTSMFKKY